jgi:L-aspartate oxidase
MEILTFDAIVVGSGAAGLTAALELAPARVSVLTKGRLGLGGSSAAAQGGIAAAVGAGDSPALHAGDTPSSWDTRIPTTNTSCNRVVLGK